MKANLVLVAILGMLAVSIAEKSVGVGVSDLTILVSGYASSPQRIYIPGNTEMQKSTVKYPWKTDEYGNRYVTVSGKFNITVNVHVDSKGLIILNNPGKRPSPSPYLNSSDLVNSDNAMIKNIARQIATSPSILENIEKLMLWTHNHVEYDEKYSNVFLSGVETLKIGKGVCDEYTNLYASLARAAGIPTRIVVGLVYSGSRWQLHAWAESKVNGVWVPVDPTFAEMGQIDATHIVIYRGPDYPYYVSPDTRLVYKVVNQSLGGYTLDMDVRPYVPKTCGPRDIFNVTLTVKNNENFIITPTYLLQATQGFDLLDDPRKTAILEPGETKTLVWRVVAPYGERTEYFLALVGPGIDKIFSMSISKRNVESVESIRIMEVFAYPEENEVVVKVSVEDTGNRDLDNISVVVGSKDLGFKEKKISLMVGEKKALVFRFPASPGYHNILVKASSGNVSDSSYVGVMIPGEDTRGKDLLNTVITYLSRNSKTIFILSLVFIFLVAGITTIVLINKRKHPFKEKEKWDKLLKMRQ